MDLEMGLILGVVVLIVFVASFFKSGRDASISDNDSRLTNDVGVLGFESDSSGDASNSCDSGDAGDSGCDSGGSSDD